MIKLFLEQISRIFTNTMINKRHLKCIKTALINAGIEFDENDEVQLKSLYSKLCSTRTKKAYHKWIKSNKLRKETFSERSLRGLINRGRRLSNNELISESDAIKIASKSYGGKEKGEQIKAGLLRKHGSRENISLVFRQRLLTVISKFFNKDVNDINANDVKKYYLDIGFFNSDVFSWKKKQLETLTKNEINDEYVEELYSMYMSYRFNRTSLESKHNGYSSTLKGWYDFKSHKNRRFYRSSWELKMFEFLDSEYALGNVVKISDPKRIQYVLNGKICHYYPDILFHHKDDRVFIIEIKPKFQLSDPKVIEKEKAARLIHGDNYKFVTEFELSNLKVWFDNV